MDLVGQEHAPDEALPAGADQDGAAIAKTQGEENVEARTKEADINAPAEAGVLQRNHESRVDPHLRISYAVSDDRLLAGCRILCSLA